MNTPEEQFESLKDEYLQESFPGDLGALLDEVDFPTESVVATELGKDIDSRKRFAVGLALVALLLVSVAVGALMLPQSTPSIGEEKPGRVFPITPKNSTPKRQMVRLFVSPSKKSLRIMTLGNKRVPYKASTESESITNAKRPAGSKTDRLPKLLHISSTPRFWRRGKRASQSFVFRKVQSTKQKR